MILLLCIIIPIALFIIFQFAVYYKKLQELKAKNVFIDVTPSFTQNIFTLQVYKKHPGLYVSEEYKYVKDRNLKHGFFFIMNKVKYLPVDLNYIKNVLQRDFQYFYERGFYHNEKDDFLSANLFAIDGEKWRNVRTKLTPAFTAGKLKGMFETLLQCGYQLEAEITRLQKTKTVDVKEVSLSHSINVISSCGFGLNSNCFDRNSNSEFRKQGVRIFEVSPMLMARMTLAFSEPELGRFLKMRLFDKETTNFFKNLVEQVVNYRKENTVSRKDIMQLLIELNNSTEEGKEIYDITEITAHAFVFFAAGFETSFAALTMCLYELSINVNVQNKLRKEIKQVLSRYNEKISYEALMDMSYMNQVINETLRKYPPVPNITRKCVMDYRVPNTDVIVEKGTGVFISIYSIHHDPEYYPNPEQFDPERFSDENKSKIPQFAYLPFGEGPRLCIGMRLGILQLKLALAMLIQKFEFLLNEKTSVPLKMKNLSFTLVPADKVLLDIYKI